MTDGATIAIVENDDDIRLQRAAFLAGEGFRGVGLSGGAGLDRLLAAGPAPDLVVLDGMLPGEDGLSIRRRLRESNGPPVVMLTAKDEDLNRGNGPADVGTANRHGSIGSRALATYRLDGRTLVVSAIKGHRSLLIPRRGPSVLGQCARCAADADRRDGSRSLALRFGAGGVPALVIEDARGSRLVACRHIVSASASLAPRHSERRRRRCAETEGRSPRVHEVGGRY